jgi:hypothetical protein
VRCAACPGRLCRLMPADDAPAIVCLLRAARSRHDPSGRKLGPFLRAHKPHRAAQQPPSEVQTCRSRLRSRAPRFYGAHGAPRLDSTNPTPYMLTRASGRRKARKGV